MIRSQYEICDKMSGPGGGDAHSVPQFYKLATAALIKIHPWIDLLYLRHVITV